MSHNRIKPRAFIYFIYSNETGRVKIGFSYNVEQRFEILKSMSPDPDLQLYGVIKGTLKKERSLHKRFNGCRSHGEWFYLTPTLARYIHEKST